MYFYDYKIPKELWPSKVVLFDRDGTLIVDPKDERVTNEEKIVLFHDTISSLKALHESGFGIILITNQAGISEDRIDEKEFNRLNSIVVKELAKSGISILATYMCPHSSIDNCECRKPKPVMVLQAIEDFGLDRSDLYIVGDHRSDVIAGVNAGIKGILVDTANHKDVAPEAVYTLKNLTEVVNTIIV